MSRAHRLITLTCFALLAPASSAAQVQLGIGAGWAVLSGDYWSGTLRPPNTTPSVVADRGFPIGAQVMVGVLGSGQLGLGIDYASIGVDGSTEKVTVLDLAAVARYFFPTGAARFFLGGKLGYSRHSTSAELPVFSSPLDWVSHGTVMGPTLGVQVPVGSVRIDLAVDGLRDIRGTWAADGGELTVGAYGKGLRIVPRVAISLTPGRE